MSIAFIAYDLNGDPLPGLTPTWSVVVNANDGIALTPPTFTELGDGAYRYNFAGTEDLTGIIDLGATANPRYQVVTADGVVSFAAFDVNGAPLSGLSPVWDFLRAVSDGLPFTPQPAITELSGGLYKFNAVLSADVIGVIDLGVTALPDTWVYDSFSLGVPLPREPVINKSQFASTEGLDISFPPFVSAVSGEQFIGTDAATMVLKSESGVLVTGVTLVFDADVNIWRGQVSPASFEEGEWRIFATSDGSNALPQFQTVWWGDYVDDILEARQAALGRWTIDSAVLTLFEEDGTTPLRQFDLKDAGGNPTNTDIHDKDPI